MDLQLFDAHCHLGWFDEPVRVANALSAAGAGALAVTVTPAEWLALREQVAGPVGVGLHPWWVADGRAGEKDVELACELVRKTRFVGEVGLDFSPAHVMTDGNELQVRAFERVCRTCAAEGGRVLSIHSVRAAGAVLDILAETGAAASCRCVFHWFSGTSEELARARRLGCWFSFGERSLATRRGREYARVAPEDRLLLETDLPSAPGTPAADGAADLLASLECAAKALSHVRGHDVHELLAKNSLQLLASPAPSAVRLHV